MSGFDRFSYGRASAGGGESGGGAGDGFCSSGFGFGVETATTMRDSENSPFSMPSRSNGAVERSPRGAIRGGRGGDRGGGRGRYASTPRAQCNDVNDGFGGEANNDMGFGASSGFGFETSQKLDTGLKTDNSTKPLRGALYPKSSAAATGPGQEENTFDGGQWKSRNAVQTPASTCGMSSNDTRIVNESNISSRATASCRYCHQEGHWANECPKLSLGFGDTVGQGQGGNTRSEFLCYNCNKPGHMSRDCSEPRRQPRPSRSSSYGGLARSSASMASVGGISDGFFEASGGFGFDGHGTAAKLKKCDVDVKEEKPMQHSFGFEEKKPTQSSFGFPSTTVGQHHRVGGSLVAAKRGENRGAEAGLGDSTETFGFAAVKNDNELGFGVGNGHSPKRVTKTSTPFASRTLGKLDSADVKADDDSDEVVLPSLGGIKATEQSIEGLGLGSRPAKSNGKQTVASLIDPSSAPIWNTEVYVYRENAEVKDQVSITNFNGAIHPKLVQNLGDTFDKTTPIQKLALAPMLNGGDVLICGQNNTGKMIACLVTTLSNMLKNSMQKILRTLILTPNPLQAERVNAIVECLANGLPIAVRLAAKQFSTGVAKKHFAHEMAGTNDQHSVFIASIDCLHELIETGQMRLNELSCVVVAEMDRMLENGGVPVLNWLAGQLGTGRSTMPQIIITACELTEKFQQHIMSGKAMLNKKTATVICADLIEHTSNAVQYSIIEVEQNHKKKKLLDELRDDVIAFRTGDSSGQLVKTLIVVEQERDAKLLAGLVSNLFTLNVALIKDFEQEKNVAALKEFGTKLPFLFVVEHALDAIKFCKVSRLVVVDLPSRLEQFKRMISNSENGTVTAFYSHGRDEQLAGDLVNIMADAGQVAPAFLRDSVPASFVQLSGLKTTIDDQSSLNNNQSNGMVECPTPTSAELPLTNGRPVVTGMRQW